MDKKRTTTTSRSLRPLDPDLVSRLVSQAQNTAEDKPLAVQYLEQQPMQRRLPLIVTLPSTTIDPCNLLSPKGEGVGGNLPRHRRFLRSPSAFQQRLSPLGEGGGREPNHPFLDSPPPFQEEDNSKTLVKFPAADEALSQLPENLFSNHRGERWDQSKSYNAAAESTPENFQKEAVSAPLNEHRYDSVPTRRHSI